MNTARQAILASLYDRLGRNKQAGSREAVQADPSPPKAAPDDRLALFIAQARVSGAGVTLVDQEAELPGAIEHFLAARAMPRQLSISDPELQRLPWDKELHLHFGRCRETDNISLIRAVGGVADTGSVIALSSVTLSTADLFLPSICLFQLRSHTIYGTFSEFLREKNMSDLPRTINLVTGPSRTSDIEQKLLIGVHGPSVVEIFLLRS